LFKISTKTNKKELAIKPLLFVYSLRGLFSSPLYLLSCTTEGTDEKEVIFYFEVSTLFVVNNLEQTQNASTVIYQ
ncbi:hypothetical protein ABHA06_05690, partial [Enterococcus faecium]